MLTTDLEYQGPCLAGTKIWPRRGTIGTCQFGHVCGLQGFMLGNINLLNKMLEVIFAACTALLASDLTQQIYMANNRRSIITYPRATDGFNMPHDHDMHSHSCTSSTYRMSKRRLRRLTPSLALLHWI